MRARPPPPAQRLRPSLLAMLCSNYGTGPLAGRAQRLFRPSMAMLGTLVAVLAIAAALSPSAASASDSCSCANASQPLRTGDVLHVAVLVWVGDEPEGLYRGKLTDTRTTQEVFGSSFVQPYMMGVDLYVEKMRARGDMLPLLDPTWSHWNYTNVYLGVPMFIGWSVLPDIPGSFTYPGSVLGLPQGLAYKVVSKDPAVLMANFGIDKPFTFIVPPVLFIDDALTALLNLVEDTKSHIVVHPMFTSREVFVCDGVDPATGVSRTPDCLDTRVVGRNRKRRGGARRFNTFVSTLADASSSQLAALDFFHTLNVRSILIIRDTVNQAFSLSMHTAKTTADAAAQLNIEVLEIIALVDGLCPGDKRCPPAGAGIVDAAIFPNGESAAEVGARIVALNPDALIILGAPGTASSWSIGQLFYEFQARDWTPKALSWGCGIEGGMANYLPNRHADLMYTWSSKPWDPQLRGPDYQNFATDTNFELLPAVEATPGARGVDGPAVFEAAYESTYGDEAPGGRHPMYTVPLKDNSTPALGFATMILIQKMIEAAQSADVEQILVAADRMAQPGISGRVELDIYGRTTRVNEVLQQLTPNGHVILAPYNIGSPPVFPLPTWSERVFAPEQYGTTGERAVVGVTAFSIALCVALLALVLANHRAPVIRAATPSFCAVIICGAICMLSSNFFATLVVDATHCAASTWLLTVGFTLLFASLFIKTFRIWRIFGGRKLQVLKMKDAELLLAVGAFVLVDVVINAAWAGTVGMGVVRVRVDPARPAYDYWQCDYSGGAMAAVYAHLAIKGAILLLGVLLTYSVRNTPSQFNESSLIGMSIYNTAFVIAFIVPILAVGLGGRETTYQLRAYAIVFTAMSCCGLLYVPKLLVLRAGSGGTTGTVSAGNGGTRVGTRKSDGGEVMSGGGGTGSAAGRGSAGQPQITPPVDSTRYPAATHQARGSSVARSVHAKQNAAAYMSGTDSGNRTNVDTARTAAGGGGAGTGVEESAFPQRASRDIHIHRPSHGSSMGLSSPMSPSGASVAGGAGGGGTASVREVGPLFVHTHSLRYGVASALSPTGGSQFGGGAGGGGLADGSPTPVHATSKQAAAAAAYAYDALSTPGAVNHDTDQQADGADAGDALVVAVHADPDDEQTQPQA